MEDGGQRGEDREQGTEDEGQGAGGRSVGGWLVPDFPRCGKKFSMLWKIRHDFSMAWKIRMDVFHAMENRFPRHGKSGGESGA